MKLIQIYILVLGFFGSTTFVNAAPLERSCRGALSDFNKSQMLQINACTKSLGYKSVREKSKKSACTMKCVLTYDNLISPDGSIVKEQFGVFIEENFPPSLIGRANMTFNPCYDELEGKYIDKEDEFCMGYDPLIKCISRNLGNFCQGLP